MGIHGLEVEGYLRRQRARGYVVGAAEGGEEVVEGVLVGDVDGGEVQIHLVVLRFEEVVLADSDVEEVAGGDAGRVFVVVLGAGGGNLHQLRCVSGCIARRKASIGNCGRYSVAGEAGLELLVGSEAAQVDSGHCLRAG